MSAALARLQDALAHLVTDARVTLPGNEIRVDWNGLSYVDGTVVDIDFTAVPEPASLALLGGWLAVCL